jgi:glucose-6-phosphate isomerase
MSGVPFAPPMIAPYSQAMRYLSAYLQLTATEGNGKSARLDGVHGRLPNRRRDLPRARNEWLAGVHQMLNQGLTTIPTDFVVSTR